MRLATPLVPDPRAPLARANPVAKLIAAVALMGALLLSLDAITAAVILAALVAALPASGLAIGSLARRARLLIIAAVTVALVNLLFAAEQQGPVVLEVGPLRIGLETLLAAGGLALRLLAIGLSGLLATATSQPTELADALIQQLRVSPRFAIGALAAVRLVPMLAFEWQTIGLARRARGVDAGRSPVAAVRLFAGRVLALLVSAIRRATRMAVAMEARGLGARRCRTSARRMAIRPGDWAWIAGAVVVAAAAVWTSMALGTWRPLLG
jgi:energy-coupling factor transport system permease protein